VTDNDIAVGIAVGAALSSILANIASWLAFESARRARKRYQLFTEFLEHEVEMTSRQQSPRKQQHLN